MTIDGSSWIPFCMYGVYLGKQTELSWTCPTDLKEVSAEKNRGTTNTTHLSMISQAYERSAMTSNVTSTSSLTLMILSMLCKNWRVSTRNCFTWRLVSSWWNCSTCIGTESLHHYLCLDCLGPTSERTRAVFGKYTWPGWWAWRRRWNWNETQGARVRLWQTRLTLLAWRLRSCLKRTELSRTKRSQLAQNIMSERVLMKTSLATLVFWLLYRGIDSFGDQPPTSQLTKEKLVPALADWEHWSTLVVKPQRRGNVPPQCYLYEEQFKRAYIFSSI